MLAEAVEGFGDVGAEAVDDVVGLLGVDGGGLVGAGDLIAFAEEVGGCAVVVVGSGVGFRVGQVAGFEGEGDFDGGGGEGGGFVVLGEGELCAGAGVGGDPGLGGGVGFGLRIAGAGYDVNDGRLADDEVEGLVVDVGGEAFGSCWTATGGFCWANAVVKGMRQRATQKSFFEGMVLLLSRG